MPNSIVIFLGRTPMGMEALEDAAGQFGWSVDTARDFIHLKELRRTHTIVAILFDAESIGLTVDEVLKRAQGIAPNAQLIPCFRFSDVVDWPELAQAGAFHTLALPLHRNEVRQSLGFVWSARSRRGANVVSMRLAPEWRTEPSRLRDAS